MTRWLLLSLLVAGCATPIPQPARTVRFPDGAPITVEYSDGRRDKVGPSEVVIPRRVLLPLCYEFSCRAHPYHLDAHCRCEDGTIFRLKV